ncbi:MAG: PASTA domain-containing protein [Bacteroidia bacterium]|nr:PASTA domain-containing protein [Bacteroidia bacterium]NNC86004.1 PASTA domain-containing protein [Bacteroidia bacterium]NNM16176.1 PASTA domain-containing protein [Bacteroidia bacterium]
MNKLKPIFQFLISKQFLLNLLIAAVAVIMLIGITYKWLGSYTNHNEAISVPDFIEMNVTDLDEFLRDKKFRYKISDSSTYNPEVPAGTIIDQDPLPGKKVKENRTIYLNITKNVAPKIKMPDIIGVQQRQAIATLKSYGLVVGGQTYIPDIQKNCVLQMKVRGKNVKPGQAISKGTKIDLVIADGFGETTIEVPDLNGMPLDEVTFLIQGQSLHLGSVIFDAGADSATATVYKQYPKFIEGERIAQGEAIDIYLK